MKLRHSLVLFFALTVFSYLTQAKELIPLEACGNIHSKHYKSITELHEFPQLIDEWVVIEGIVTLQKLKDYDGFWLQQENNFSDTINASHGIFIYHPKSSFKTITVNSGQHIRLLAQVAEYHGLTQLKSVQDLTVCAEDLPLPDAISITLPFNSLFELKILEGMRVVLTSGSIVSDLFGSGYGLGNYGQFGVSSKLHFQPTELNNAEDIGSRKLHIENHVFDYLLVDDGYSIRSPKFIPFPNITGFSANNPLRIGDHVGQIFAVLHRYKDRYILIPDGPASNIKIKTQPRPRKPIVSKTADVVIANINVENYFNGDPKSEKIRDIGFPTSRGAKTYAHFMMQTQKLVAALSIINADVISLMEIENDGYGEHSAIADLTRALNKKMIVGKKYRYVIPSSKRLGRDRISVGILYRSNKMSTSGQAHIVDYSKHTNYQSRPSLIQKFMFDGKIFYLAVNHFKSKGRPCTPDLRVSKPVQGSCNAVRKKAALALSHYIEHTTDSTEPVLIVGDLNSYSKEDPLLVLEEAGYTNINSISALNLRATPIFSYSFQGHLGNLDHALANRAMLPLIRSVDSWSINSVEDILLRYDSDYAKPDAYRSSDHDPLVIGIELN